LAEKLEVMELGEKSRVMLRVEEARRKKASKRKKAGRKYRKVEGEGEGEEVVGEADELDPNEEGRLGEEAIHKEVRTGQGRGSHSAREGKARVGKSNESDPP
jgi:hypothetical protein